MILHKVKQRTGKTSSFTKRRERCQCFKPHLLQNDQSSPPSVTSVGWIYFSMKQHRRSRQSGSPVRIRMTGSIPPSLRRRVGRHRWLRAEWTSELVVNHLCHRSSASLRTYRAVIGTTHRSVSIILAAVWGFLGCHVLACMIVKISIKSRDQPGHQNKGRQHLHWNEIFELT